MKRKILLLFVTAVLSALVLTGCAKEKKDVYEVNSDFGIADVSWGETGGECIEKLGKNFYSDKAGNIKAENLEFYGENTSIKLIFEQECLNAIEIQFPEDFDKQAVVDKISEVWGARNEYYESESGEKIAAPEENHYWQRDDGLVKASFQTDIESGAEILVIDATKLLVSLGLIPSE